MAIQVTRQGDNTVNIEIGPRFDFSLNREFHDAYHDTDSNTRFIIIMNETEYMDSAALGMLLMLREHAGGQSSEIRLAGCQPSIRQILQISNFNKLFEIE